MNRVIGRRTVVRTAVVTAWTAPLVQAVASAPAFAVSGPADLGKSTATGSISGNTFTVTVTIVNGGGAPTVGLTAMLSWAGGSGSTIDKTGSAPTGWSPVGTSAPVTSWTAKTQVPAGGSTTVAFSFTPTNPGGKNKATGTATVTLTTSGGTGGSASAKF